MEKETLRIKVDPTKRKMPPEELQVYLRESRRGTGIHGVKSNRMKRRQQKQQIKGGKYEHC